MNSLSDVIRRGAVLIAALAAVTLGGPRESAAQARTQSPEECSCRLGGHRFLLSNLVQHPFVGTQVHTFTGGGVALGFEEDLEIPLPDSSVVKALTGDLAFVTLGFTYQQRLWTRFAVGLTVAGSARLGMDTQAVLAQGVTSILATEFWARGEVLRREAHLLSLGVRVQPSSVAALDPLGWAKRVIEDGGIEDDNTIVRTTESTTVAAGAQYAWGIRPWIGWIVGGEIGTGDALDDDDDRKWKWRASTEVSLDLMDLWGWPLGGFVGFRQDQFSESASDIIDHNRSVGFGVFYTGREDFSIGLEFHNVSAKLKDADPTLDSNTVTFNIRYFF